MQKIALNEVCELFSGFPLGSKDFAEAGNLSVIQLRDVDRNSIRLNDLQSTDKVLATKRKLLNYGDVLFKARGPRLEAINLPLKPENTIATNGFIILRPQSQVHPSYIAWLLNNMNLDALSSKHTSSNLFPCGSWLKSKCQFRTVKRNQTS